MFHASNVRVEEKGKAMNFSQAEWPPSLLIRPRYGKKGEKKGSARRMASPAAAPRTRSGRGGRKPTCFSDPDLPPSVPKKKRGGGWRVVFLYVFKHCPMKKKKEGKRGGGKKRRAVGTEQSASAVTPRDKLRRRKGKRRGRVADQSRHVRRDLTHQGQPFSRARKKGKERGACEAST